MPVYPAPEDILYHEGTTFTAEWYYSENGALPALEYYRQLKESDQLRLDYIVKYMANNPIGTHLPETMYKIEDREHKIYAFKPGAQRFFNFMSMGRKIILTNAYQKHSNKMARQDLEKLKIAVHYGMDYQRRLREGTYYEKHA